jgi:hypothetical protein
MIIDCKYQLLAHKHEFYFRKQQFFFILMRKLKIDAHKLVFRQTSQDTSNHDVRDLVIILAKV